MIELDIFEGELAHLQLAEVGVPHKGRSRSV